MRPADGRFSLNLTISKFEASNGETIDAYVKVLVGGEKKAKTERRTGEGHTIALSMPASPPPQDGRTGFFLRDVLFVFARM